MEYTFTAFVEGEPRDIFCRLEGLLRFGGKGPGSPFRIEVSSPNATDFELRTPEEVDNFLEDRARAGQWFREAPARAAVRPALSPAAKRHHMRFSVIPLSTLPALAAAMADGAVKYGPHNWRNTPIQASDYIDKVMRHEQAWWAGEDFAPDSKVSHLIHAAADLLILADAIMCNTFVDDRPKLNGGNLPQIWKAPPDAPGI